MYQIPDFNITEIFIQPKSHFFLILELPELRVLTDFFTIKNIIALK